MAIRYDDSLRDEIRRTVKNYQAKRKRVISKGGELLPDPAYVSTFLTEYTNRRTLLRDLKKLQRYSERGAEEVIDLESGQRVTRYELGELKRLVTSAKRNITRELKQAPDWNTMQPITRAHYEHLQSRYRYLSRPLSSLSKRQFVTYERIAYGEGDIEKKRQTFYNNIQKMAEDITFGLSKDLSDRFKQALDRLSLTQLTDLVATNPYLSGILDWYAVITGGGEIPNYEDAVEHLINYVNAL